LTIAQKMAAAKFDAAVTAVDWPGVLPITRRVAERLNLAGQLKTSEGDLQKVDFGTGYHFVTLGHILHSEGEAQSRKLLKKIFDALAPGGVVAIAEFAVNDDRSGPAMPLIFAVNMLVETEQGDTFTFAQMAEWLHEIGFEKMRQLEAPAISPILLGTKPA